MRDHYLIAEAGAEATLKIERSVFSAHVFPCRADEEFFAVLEELQKKYFDATHHCWAFRLIDGERARSSDAGEPTGTAGRPILQSIESSALWNAGVVVVRYYGGVKLGTGGLSRAYRDAAAAALELTPRGDHFLYETIVLETSFAALNSVYRMIAPPDVVLTSEEFGDGARFTLAVRKSKVDDFTSRLTERQIPFHR